MACMLPHGHAIGGGGLGMGAGHGAVVPCRGRHALLFGLTAAISSQIKHASTDLYAILKCTEKLERSYVRDAISARDYEPACRRLIAQYRTLWETVKGSVPSVTVFMASYGMQCPMAARRLVESGMPATVEHGRPGLAGESVNYTAAVADAVGAYITTMDALKLNMSAVDQVYPLLSDLTQSLNKVPSSPWRACLAGCARGFGEGGVVQGRRGGGKGGCPGGKRGRGGCGGTDGGLAYWPSAWRGDRRDGVAASAVADCLGASDPHRQRPPPITPSELACRYPPCRQTCPAD